MNDLLSDFKDSVINALESYALERNIQLADLIALLKDSKFDLLPPNQVILDIGEHGNPDALLGKGSFLQDISRAISGNQDLGIWVTENDDLLPINEYIAPLEAASAPISFLEYSSDAEVFDSPEDVSELMDHGSSEPLDDFLAGSTSAPSFASANPNDGLDVDRKAQAENVATQADQGESQAPGISQLLAGTISLLAKPVTSQISALTQGVKNLTEWRASRHDRYYGEAQAIAAKLTDNLVAFSENHLSSIKAELQDAQFWDREITSKFEDLLENDRIKSEWYLLQDQLSEFNAASKKAIRLAESQPEKAENFHSELDKSFEAIEKAGAKIPFEIKNGIVRQDFAEAASGFRDFLKELLAKLTKKIFKNSTPTPSLELGIESTRPRI